MLTPLRKNAWRSIFLICVVSSVGAPAAAGGSLDDRSIGMERRADEVLGHGKQDTGKNLGKGGEIDESPPPEEWQRDAAPMPAPAERTYEYGIPEEPSVTPLMGKPGTPSGGPGGR
jgi:hypothetical protein